MGDIFTSLHHGVVVSILSCQSKGPGFKPHTKPFLTFFNFMFFKMPITFFSKLEGSTNFHILIYMPIGSYHINKKFRLSPALSLILLSKMTKFSPKNRTFLLIKPDMMVTDTFHWYHTDPQASAVPASCLTQKFWISFLSRSQQLCSLRILGAWDCYNPKLVT